MYINVALFCPSFMHHFGENSKLNLRVLLSILIGVYSFVENRLLIEEKNVFYRTIFYILNFIENKFIIFK